MKSKSKFDCIMFVQIMKSMQHAFHLHALFSEEHIDEVLNTIE